jgi:hypothetical protein
MKILVGEMGDQRNQKEELQGPLELKQGLALSMEDLECLELENRTESCQWHVSIWAAAHLEEEVQASMALYPFASEASERINLKRMFYLQVTFFDGVLPQVEPYHSLPGHQEYSQPVSWNAW